MIRAYREIIIPSGASISGSLVLSYQTLIALQVPAGWTAAGITFEVSLDGVTFVPLYWNGSEYTLSAAALRGHSIDPSALLGWDFVRVRSGTAAAPVVQAAERLIKCIISSL